MAWHRRSGSGSTWYLIESCWQSNEVGKELSVVQRLSITELCEIWTCISPRPKPVGFFLPHFKSVLSIFIWEVTGEVDTESAFQHKKTKQQWSFGVTFALIRPWAPVPRITWTEASFRSLCPVQLAELGWLLQIHQLQLWEMQISTTHWLRILAERIKWLWKVPWRSLTQQFHMTKYSRRTDIQRQDFCLQNQVKV